MTMIRPKMLNSSRLFRTLRYSVLVLLFLFAIPLLNHPSAREKYAELIGDHKDEKGLFVADYLENEIDGSFNGSELAKLCASKVWRRDDEAIILTCQPVPGGIGEVKNGHLQCIRFAIEIGGASMSISNVHYWLNPPSPPFFFFVLSFPEYSSSQTAQLVLPRITRRSPGDISNLNGEQHAKGQPLDYMFSSEHLTTSLRSHCPQMRVHASLDDLYDRPSLLRPLGVSYPMLADRFDNIEGVFVPVFPRPAGERIRARFDALYDRELPPDTKDGGRRYPVRVDLETYPFIWPAAGDGEALRRDFGRLLRVREDIRALAASALYNLVKRFGLPVDPRGGMTMMTMPVMTEAVTTATTKTTETATSTASHHGDVRADGDPATRFVGVHLRTERDVDDRELGFPSYEEQAAYFLDHLRASGAGSDGRHRVIYLATGLFPGDDDVRGFRARAAELNATVVTKRDVLGPAEVTLLNNRLTWDQRALVDYEVMLRAGFVLGVVESSFAWNLAMRRGNVHSAAGAEYAGYLGMPEERPWTVDMGLVMWKDRYSKLCGRTPRGVSMFNGIWP